MCAIVGIYGNDNAARLASIALFAMQHRGQEATGISSSCDGKIHTIKNRGLVSEVFTEEALNEIADITLQNVQALSQQKPQAVAKALLA